MGSYQPHSTSGRNAHIFNSPRTPGYSSANTYGSSSNDFSLNPGRKRARPESAGQPFNTPYSATANGWSDVSEPMSQVRSDYSRQKSPEPFVNTKYKLKDGMDTPTLRYATLYTADNDHGESDFRRRWNAPGQDQQHNEAALTTPSVLAGERNGKRREPSSSSTGSRKGWGRMVFNLVGGVAGKMWQFCSSIPIKGFYAGGGQGYDLYNSGHEMQNSFWGSANDTHAIERSSTPVPGQYPVQEPDYPDTPAPVNHRGGGYFPESVESPESRPRPAKRLHTSTGSGWVMVDQDGAGGVHDQAVGSPDLGPRRSPAPSLSAKSKLPRPSLSRAQSKPLSRRSLIPVSRRTSSASHTGSPATYKPGTASYASSRSPNISTPKNGSPMSPEAQRYAARMAREERETDRNFHRFNSQLEDMIRQGKEALGTKIEVGDDMEESGMVDEGYYDHNNHPSSTKW
ncbi:hypothetical protein K402DRAFT_392668 [Aulographum hederae CBS 113979]|uniref:Uncharacterized protein n=1 Tax=Aulographum hederae CBS 113979 TaxID=1176131 RepID=A0A6G1H2W3_9PEZI|nr:hypothetical protein K402DRAFT_392668 [Aulographum hederae CBS 113979]